MALTVKEILILSGAVFVSVLLIVFPSVSTWSLPYKLPLIIAGLAGLGSVFYFFNKRNPEAAARRRLAFALITLGSGTLSLAALSFDVTASIFGQNIIFKIGEHCTRQKNLTC